MGNFLSRWARGALLCLVLLGAATGPAQADGGQIVVDSVRATSFPQVTVRFTATGPGGVPLPALKSDDFVVQENDQKIN
jgi:hypothetical protein